MKAVAFLAGTLRDLRHAVRALRVNPAFSITVALTLALGIGATTAIYSVVNSVVIKPLPYPEPEAVVTVTHSAVFGNVRGSGFPFSPQMLETYATNGQAFEELGVYRAGQAAVTGVGDPDQVNTLLVSQGVLRALGVQPALGRWFSHEDDQPGAQETTLLSYAYWQRALGGDPEVIGRTVIVDSRPREVIGVMTAGFAFGGRPVDLILPLRIDLTAPQADFSYNALARLKAGVTVEEANADIGRMLPIFLERYVGNGMDALHLQPNVHPLKEDIVGNVGQILWVLLGGISILLLIACANVANLLLVHTEARGAELAVRTALGAGLGRLARGLIVEGLVLSLIGGFVGVGLGYVGLRALLALEPGNLPRLDEVTLDSSVLAVAALTSIVAGLFFGMVPILKIAGRNFASHLAESMHGNGRWASAGKRQSRSQNALVVAQVALALVLLVSSGLMIRTFQNLLGVDPGFTHPDTVQTVRVSLPEAMGSEPARAVLLQRQMLERLAAIPGVTSAAYIDRLPTEGGAGYIVAQQDKTYASDETPPGRRIKLISPGLLRTLGTPVLLGREFDWTEVESQRNVALVSESYAREEWNSVESALGKRIRVGTVGPWQEVIGVVADIHDFGADQDAPPIVYWPAREHPVLGSQNLFPLSVAFALRTDRTGTEGLLREIRRAVSEVMPDLPLAQVRTLAEAYSASMARTSFSLILLGVAGTMALLLSIVGVYGVLAYAVIQRRREVGIRLALGAEPQAVRRMFVYRGMVLAGIGIALGVAVAAGATRLMSSLLFGVTPIDAVTFVAAAACLALAALCSSYVPARRAAAISPAKTLRD